MVERDRTSLDPQERVTRRDRSPIYVYFLRFIDDIYDKKITDQPQLSDTEEVRCGRLIRDFRMCVEQDLEYWEQPDEALPILEARRRFEVGLVFRKMFIHNQGLLFKHLTICGLRYNLKSPVQVLGEAARDGLIKALTYFDPDHDPRENDEVDEDGDRREVGRFSTYAVHTMMGATSNEMKKRVKMQQGEVSFSEVNAHQQDDMQDPIEETFADTEASSHEEAVALSMAWELVNTIMGEVLNGVQLQVMQLRFLEGLTLEEAGAQLGVSRESVRQAEKNSLALIRNQLRIRNVTKIF